VRTNRLLDLLSLADRTRVLDGCEKVELSIPEVLDKPGDSIRHAYFPTGSFISLLTPMGGKDSLEVALAGDEGIYGVPLALGVDVSPVNAVVQGGGMAWRMGAAAFRSELLRTPKLRACIDRYIYVLMSQLSQTAGCNRFHVVEQRVARWLLMTADRSHSATFRITHEILAHMLGVRREGITEAASALQRRSLIGYTRGVVTILNRRGLQRAACSCYRSDLATYKRTFR
jgi:CRP-like cAMP-binding protein